MHFYCHCHDQIKSTRETGVACTTLLPTRYQSSKFNQDWARRGFRKSATNRFWRRTNVADTLRQKECSRGPHITLLEIPSLFFWRTAMRILSSCRWRNKSPCRKPFVEVVCDNVADFLDTWVLCHLSLHNSQPFFHYTISGKFWFLFWVVLVSHGERIQIEFSFVVCLQEVR